jgi:hypothetical protein
VEFPGYDVGSIAVRDLDHDGIEDVAVTGRFGSTQGMAVALGNGDGTFGAPIPVPASAHVDLESLLIADLDGDSNLDLAAIELGSSTLTVALGNGDGTFEPATDYQTDRTNLADLAVGDLDRDRDLDLVTADAGEQSISVLENDGTGSFHRSGSVALPSGQPGSVTLADFDGDGALDVATTPVSPGVAVLDGRGDLTFDSPRFLPVDGGQQVESADLNGDAVPDLAVADTSHTLSILEGVGAGNFDTPVALTTGNYPASIAITDLNGDNRPDLVTGNSAGHSISTMLNTGQPTAEADPGSLAFGPRRVGTTSAAQTVTFVNKGSAALRVTSSGVAGSDSDDFVVTRDGCSGESVLVGRICELRVRFTPSAPGSRSATLQLTDDAPGSPQELTLSGSGTTGPTATPSPGSIAFGSQPAGTTTPEQRVTLTAGGDEALHLTGAFLSGASPASYALTDDTCSGATLTPSETCHVDVAFAAAGSGPRAATLVFVDDAGDSPQSVSLSGTSESSAPVASTSIATQASGNTVLGGAVSDTALLGGGQAPTGQIAFRLYGPGDASCSGAPAFTDVVAVSGNGGYHSADFTPTKPGVYRWVAAYSGDAGNDPATHPCDVPSERVVVSAPPEQPPSPASPEISDLRLDPAAFRASAAKTPPQRKQGKGTTVRFTLSESAEVSIQVRSTKRGSGRRGASLPAITRDLGAGEQAVKFTGTVGKRTLRPGRYLMIVGATDSGGQKAQPQSVPLRVLRD